MSFLHFDIVEAVKTFGYLGMSLVVFLESGVFFGFFLPGGSMIFTAGLLASQGMFNIYGLTFLFGLSAILGDNFGYWFGKKVGDKIFSREDSLFFHKKHLTETKNFYEKYGPMTLVLGRFVPIVRTFAPILAGVGKMEYKRFLIFNIIGSLCWAVGLVLLGFFLGEVVPGIEKYILPIIITIIILSVLPILFKFLRQK